ncbi:MAG: DoxX family protein [Bacteroidota bacterium]
MKKISFRLANYAAILLGSFFIVSGASKIFTYSSFLSTISSVISIGVSKAKVLAAIVIAGEIILGSLFVMRRRVLIAAGLICLTISVYIVVLYSSVMTGKLINCNCFGIFKLALPNYLEIALDFLLFDLTALIAIIINSERAASKSLSPALGIVTFIVLLVFELQIVQSAYDRSKSFLHSGSAASGLDVLLSIARQAGYFQSQDDQRAYLLFMLKYYDFTCAICYDDFISLSDSVANNYSRFQGQVAALIEQGGIVDSMDLHKLSMWAEANGIVYPIHVVPAGIFGKYGVMRSTVALFNNKGSLIYSHEIPIGVKDRERILSMLTGERHQ